MTPYPEMPDSPKQVSFSELGSMVGSVHALLQRLSASPVESVGIQPERLISNFIVEKQREPKFTAAIHRLLSVAQAFPFRSPLVLLVHRSVRLNKNDELDQSEWVVQFQLNEFGRPKAELLPLVRAQADALRFELESFLFD